MAEIPEDLTAAEARRRTPPEGGEAGFYRARTGRRIRYCFWPARWKRPRGTVFLLPGRAEFIEKHYETVADLLDRGFAVLAFDWRNQGLSGRPLGDPQRHHVRDFRVLADDLTDLIGLKAATRWPQPWYALAHSMGAFVFLKFLESDPEKGEAAFRKAVLVSPMLGLDFSPFGERLGKFLIRRGLARDKHEQFAPLQRPYGKWRKSAFAQRRLTSDPGRFEDEHWQIERNPQLAVGGVTYGWLEAATRGLEELFASDLPETNRLPVLFVLAGQDRVVDVSAAQAFIKRMRRATSVLLKDARHEILKERDEIRDTFWKLFDNFISAK